MITLRDVHYTYPGETGAALNGVTLEIAEGEILALVGSNGAGKSTLCYTIAGFVPHYFHGELRGEVIVDGRNTVEHPLGELVKHTGLVFHNPLNQISGARFTVREELGFGLENLGVPRREMLARIEQALGLVGIAHLADRSPFELSGGQQQRVALASILVMGPRVLLLDEPTAQLDPLGTKEVFAAIKALSRSGVTVVLAEHKPELIAGFADRVVVLHQGQIWTQGPPRTVLADAGLDAIGVSVSRYTQAARAGLQRGMWPGDQPLPVTLDEAVAGFGGDVVQAGDQPVSEAARRGER